jgi:hypothetical protein
MKNLMTKVLVPVLQGTANAIIDRMKVAGEAEVQKLYEFGMMLVIYTDFYLDVELD